MLAGSGGRLGFGERGFEGATCGSIATCISRSKPQDGEANKIRPADVYGKPSSRTELDALTFNPYY